MNKPVGGATLKRLVFIFLIIMGTSIPISHYLGRLLPDTPDVRVATAWSSVIAWVLMALALILCVIFPPRED